MYCFYVNKTVRSAISCLSNMISRFLLSCLHNNNTFLFRITHLFTKLAVSSSDQQNPGIPGNKALWCGSDRLTPVIILEINEGVVPF